MTTGQPAPVRRPESARPREAAHPEVAPPTPQELAAMQRHLALLPLGEGGSARDDPELGVTIVHGPGSGPDTSYAAMPRRDAVHWPARLAALVQRMRAEGTWPSLLWCDPLDRPIGLDAELPRLGWEAVFGERVLWVGHATVVPHLDPRLRIEAVQPRSMATHEDLERRIFGLGSDQVERRRPGLASALEAGRLRAWIVWLEDEPVAVGRLSQGDGVAALQGIGVAEPWRGQGFGTLVTTVATRAGLALGNRIVWLSVREENGPAQRLYARLGYRPAFGWTRWLVTADPRRR